ICFFFFFQAEDGIRDFHVTGVQTCALPISEHGLEYCCDWANDDMPYLMETPEGGLYSMPLAQETDDRAVTLDLHQTELEWLQQEIGRASCRKECRATR